MRRQGRTLPCLSTSSGGEVAEVKNKSDDHNSGSQEVGSLGLQEVRWDQVERGLGWSIFGEVLQLNPISSLREAGTRRQAGVIVYLRWGGNCCACMRKSLRGRSKQTPALWGSQPASSPEGLLLSSTTSLLCCSPSRRRAAAAPHRNPAD